jgi:hypothetical protein
MRERGGMGYQREERQALVTRDEEAQGRDGRGIITRAVNKIGVRRGARGSRL